MSMSSLTRSELSREISAPISDDDYGVHPPRGPYPGKVLPDAHAAELKWHGSVGRRIRILEMENEQLRAELRRLEARR